MLKHVDKNMENVTNLPLYFFSVCSLKEGRFPRGALSNFLVEKGAVGQISLDDWSRVTKIVLKLTRD